MPRPGEFELIARYFAPMAGEGAYGLTDDAAFITPPPGHDLIVTKDMLIGDGHFLMDAPAGLNAGKALRANLSDLAAKGAKPLGFLLGLALPEDWREDWLADFSAGLAADATLFGCPLLGGDTVKARGALTVSITALGSVPHGTMVRRTTAQAGDILYVTGTIGEAALGLKLLDGSNPAWADALGGHAKQALVARYRTPQPRNALAEALLRHARAAMDISDGFVGDLTKMLAAAGVSAVVPASDVPLSDATRAAIAADPACLETALTGGDDYEVLAAIRPEHEAAFIAGAREAGVPVTRLAKLADGGCPLQIRDGSGRALAFDRGSFSHFE